MALFVSGGSWYGVNGSGLKTGSCSRRGDLYKRVGINGKSAPGRAYAADDGVFFSRGGTSGGDDRGPDASFFTD